MAIWLSQQREVRWNSVNHEKMSVSHSYWRHVKKIHISIVISSFIIIQKEERKEKYMFLWLTFFSQKCPLQNVSIQHTIWCLLRKSSHFKRCLCLKGFFLYIQKCEKTQLLICIYNHHNLEFVDSHTNKKGEPLVDIFEHVLGQVPKIPPPVVVFVLFPTVQICTFLSPLPAWVSFSVKTHMNLIKVGSHCAVIKPRVFPTVNQPLFPIFLLLYTYKPKST